MKRSTYGLSGPAVERADKLQESSGHGGGSRVRRIVCTGQSARSVSRQTKREA